MPSWRIDRDQMRAAIRRARDTLTIDILWDLIEFTPERLLRRVAAGYLHLDRLQLRRRPKAGLPARIRRFERASLAREYYEAFPASAHSSTTLSLGTRAWLAECRGLLGLCAAEARRGRYAVALAGFDTLFRLLEHLDSNPDEILFFADEGNSLSAGIDWPRTLPPWFRCLAKTAAPEAFARRVHDAIDRYGFLDRPKLLAAARRAGNSAQRKALRPRQRPPEPPGETPGATNPS